MILLPIGIHNLVIPHWGAIKVITLGVEAQLGKATDEFKNLWRSSLDYVYTNL